MAPQSVHSCHGISFHGCQYLPMINLLTYLSSPGTDLATWNFHVTLLMLPTIQKAIPKVPSSPCQMMNQRSIFEHVNDHGIIVFDLKTCAGLYRCGLGCRFISMEAAQQFSCETILMPSTLGGQKRHHLFQPSSSASFLRRANATQHIRNARVSASISSSRSAAGARAKWGEPVSWEALKHLRSIMVDLVGHYIVKVALIE